MLHAVIFDFDGIIVDTEPLHYRAFQEVLQPLDLGYSWDTYLDLYIGFDDRDAFREVFKRAGRQLNDQSLKDLINRKASFFQEIVEKKIEPYPGVLELVESLSGKVPIALCSGALKSDIEPILNQLGILTSFDAIVTAEEVKNSKPDPESYLLAVRRLQEAFPERNIFSRYCIAIEDTPAGITSALKAGMQAIAVTNSYQADVLHGAILVTDSLVKVDISLLRTILSGIS